MRESLQLCAWEQPHIWPLPMNPLVAKTLLNANQAGHLLWLKLGDRNTGFFHAITKSRKRANGFSVIEKEDGTMVHKEEEIVAVIGNYFENLFTSQPGEREETVRQALHPIVSAEDNMMLTALPSASEIKEAAFSINADKAPCPDGFSASFFHTH